MFSRKNVLFIWMVVFFVIVFNRVSFTQETELETDTSAVEESADEKARVIPANYQAVELVREFGMGMFVQSAQCVFSPDNKVIYVSDPAMRQILAFDLQGDLIFSFGGQKGEYRAKVDEGGKEEEGEVERKREYDEENRSRISGLMNIGVDAKGNVYAVDYYDNGVKIFTSDGKFVSLVPLQVGLQKKSPGSGATGVAINSRGDIYIVDGANGRVQVNDINGKYKYQIAKFKDKAGRELSLAGPGHPKINSLDELYIVDPLICRVHRFNVKGRYMGSFGYMGDGAGGFNAPNGLAIDKLDRVYVSDRGFSVIQVFSKQGNFLYALCDENGRKLAIPFVNGVSVDSDNLIYVSVNDDKGYHIKVFRYIAKTAK